MAYIVLMCR